MSMLMFVLMVMVSVAIDDTFIVYFHLSIMTIIMMTTMAMEVAMTSMAVTMDGMMTLLTMHLKETR